MPHYSAVFFDLYGTLVDIRTDESSERAWTALCDALAIECGALYSSNEALRERFETLAAPVRAAAENAHGEWGEPDLLPVYQGLTARVASRSALRLTRQAGGAAGMPGGVAGDTADGMADVSVAGRLAWTFRRASTSLLRLYPSALELLGRLQAAGLRVVLVSNAQSCYTRPELGLLGLDDAFDRILISSEEGVRKPSPDIFRRALAREGLRPDQVVMVGNDSVSDIAGARAAGIDGIYLRTAISPPDDPDVCKDAVLSLTGADYAGIKRFLGVQ
ncbi:HAD family hydrolase [Bifidobacterium olomucense]|uniref:Haloacid dehalogenase-like hydrolase n=1 Tax=Bifidobacterium olomucense TaxID=2675324 RepID=A0A7Y0EY77_9BIFI|nr:HAD family hydrolase [Bifidobacterium sp. DSM 109959]NMM98594.1 Haloacid dehalogenase-like hydrolase [Bifidobacterium sp. DSM 109959]